MCLTQLDLESRVWICSSQSDGSKAEDWRKVTCQIRSGELWVETPSDGRMHRLPLSQCTVEKVAGRISENWHHARMHIEGFDTDASLVVRHNAISAHGDVNGVTEAILLTAVDVHERDGALSEFVGPQEVQRYRCLYAKREAA